MSCVVRYCLIFSYSLLLFLSFFFSIFFSRAFFSCLTFFVLFESVLFLVRTVVFHTPLLVGYTLVSIVRLRVLS